MLRNRWFQLGAGIFAMGTVKKHVQNILRKLHARNRAAAVARLRPSV